MSKKVKNTDKEVKIIDTKQDVPAIRTFLNAFEYQEPDTQPIDPYSTALNTSADLLTDISKIDFTTILTHKEYKAICGLISTIEAYSTSTEEREELLYLILRMLALKVSTDNGVGRKQIVQVLGGIRANEGWRNWLPSFTNKEKKPDWNFTE